MDEIEENNDIIEWKGGKLVKVKTMINRFKAKDKKSANKYIGAIKNNQSEFFKSDIVEVNMDELAKAILQGKTIVPAVIDGKLIDANFKEQQLFALDIDNTDLPLNKLKAKFRNYPYSMIYTSFSHSIAVPKYRILLIADRVITDPQEARQVTLALQELVGCADEKCVDVSRIFFAGKNIIEKHNRTFSVDKLLANTSVKYDDVKAPVKNKKVDIVATEDSGTDNKIITKEEVINNLEKIKDQYEGIVVDYNGSFDWFNKNVKLTDVLNKKLNTKIRCLHPDHEDKDPSAMLYEYEGQIYYRCSSNCVLGKPKSTISALAHLLDMEEVEVQYLISDALEITLGSTYQRDMRLLIADTKANITRMIKQDSILGKEMKYLWGILSVIQDFASAKVTTEPLSVNMNRPTFFISKSQVKQEMQRLQIKGASNAYQKIAQLKDLGFIRPLKDEEINPDALAIAKEEQEKNKLIKGRVHMNRVEYYELCAITPSMIRSAEETIKRNKQLGVKKKNMNVTRRIAAHGENFTEKVNVQDSIKKKVVNNKNQKEYDKILLAAVKLMSEQGYFTEDQLRKTYDPKRKVRKEVAVKLINDSIPNIIKTMGIKKDRVKKSTKEKYSINSKIKTNTVIYC